MLDDRRVERDDVVALLQHGPPPLALDVVLEQHAVVAVVVARAEPAVDLTAREHEAAALGQRDDLVHRDRFGGAHPAADASHAAMSSACGGGLSSTNGYGGATCCLRTRRR